MIVSSEDMWQLHADGHVVAVTTNGNVRQDGKAVMGAGNAKAAAIKHPKLQEELGTKLQIHGNHVYWWPEFNLITFPTKEDWQKPSSIWTIERSIKELIVLLNEHKEIKHVYLPKPGCGLGQLTWATVDHVLSKYEDQMEGRITIVENAR